MKVEYGTLEKSGRLVIPAAFRKKLGLTPGMPVTLILDEENNQVTVTSSKVALNRMEDYFSGLRPVGELWSEELVRNGARKPLVKNADSYLLDASTILALLGREPRHEKVAALLSSVRIYVCAATLLEVAAKLLRKGASQPEVANFLAVAPATIGTVVSFDHNMTTRGLTHVFPECLIG